MDQKTGNCLPMHAGKSKILDQIFVKVHVPNFFGGCQGRRTGVAVTTVFNSLISGRWVTNVLKNGDKNGGGGRKGG